jgi:FkbM family methyltransferase
MAEDRSILKSQIPYHWSKLAPFGSKVKIKLKNGIEYHVRAKTMDRSIIKEVWMQNIYDQHDIRVEDGDTVIDIGGHIGVFSVYAAFHNPSGKVYAFEPFSENFKKLAEHKKINNLEVHNKGISDRDGKQTLFLSPDNNTGGHSLHLKQQSERTAEIETTTLTGFCEANKIEKIDFLKLDCEGAEFDIVKSNEAILNIVDKVIMECHPFADNTVNSMISLLEKHQFVVKRQEGRAENECQMLYARRK